MHIILRDYQKKAVDQIRSEIQKGNRRVLLVLPTGSGKSHTMGDIAKKAIDKSHKILALMHRRQLVTQLLQRFEECGVNSAMIMSGEEHNLDCNAQIATCQTYTRRLKLKKDNNNFFIDAAIVFIDEAHHALSNTYQNILSNYNEKIVIGVTATPILASGVGMGNYFDAIVQPVSIKELIDQKHLVPGVYYGPSSPDLSKIKTVVGDYEKKGLDEVVNQPRIIGDVVKNWLKIAGGLSTMVFSVNVNHSKALCKEFNDNGITAEHLDAHSIDEEREDALRRFRNGDTQVLLNVALFTEGTDIPEIECIVLARPTKSLGLHLQMIGRGARPNKGKDSFTVIDHGGNVNRLGYYEDEIEWLLTEKEIGFKKKEVRKKEKKIRTCEECHAQFTGPTCPICSKTILGYGKMIEAEEAKLIALSKKKKKEPTTEEKIKFYGMLEYHRKEKKYVNGWTAIQFNKKYKEWPKNMNKVPDQKPDKTLKNWITYQNIKYAKSKKYGGKK